MMNLLMQLIDSHYYSNLHFWLIIVHVVGALFSLVLAPVAMITRKGSTTHRQWGKAYFWGMFLTNATALILLAWRFNVFLLGVTILSFYAALSGYRVLYRKRPLQGHGPTRFDWASAGVALAAGVMLVAWGVLTALGVTQAWIPGGGSQIIFVVLPIVFGLLIANDANTDLRMFRAPSTDPHWWWYYHMERMLGSYVALWTALMVQQVGPRLPFSIQWVVWVAPAAVGTVAIAYWIRRYRRMFAGQSAQESGTGNRGVRRTGRTVLGRTGELPARATHSTPRPQ
jgi:hypothetical protein